MHRGSSPIFDVPEFPSMRRVKPLPKRRHTVAHDGENSPMLATPTGGRVSGAHGSDGLIANANALSAQLALHSYYMPILGSAQDLQPDDNADLRDKADLGYHLGVRAQDDEHNGDGDYIDHLQQPGNTKKRKVPANAGTSPHGGHDAVMGSMGEDDDSGGAVERGSALGADRDGGDPLLASGAMNGTMGNEQMGLRGRGTLSRPTMIGLQHKEMLRQRKRQLAAVLGAISHGDTLALDQALISTYAVPSVTADFQQPRIRLSRRQLPRIARRAKSLSQVNLNIGLPFPTAFTFSCHSASEYDVPLLLVNVMTIRARAFSFRAPCRCQRGSGPPAHAV